MVKMKFNGMLTGNDLESHYITPQVSTELHHMKNVLLNPCPAEPGYTLPLQTV